MGNKRNFFIDIIKGVSIFLMLWGHCIQVCVAKSDIDFFENVVFKTIYSFHMPLFMLISGYLFFFSFEKRNMKELLIHRTQSLLQPIFLCSIFNFFVTTALFSLVSGNFGDILNGKWIQELSSLWFLWSILAAAFVTTIICKKIKNVFIQILLFFVCIPIVAVFPNAGLNIFMYPYFIIGFYFAKYKDKLPKCVYNIKYLSLILFPLLMCYYDKKHFIYTTGIFPSENYAIKEMLFIDLYRWLIGLVGSIFAITVLQIVYTKIVLKTKRRIISRGFSLLGEKSLQIYSLSIPFLSVYLSVAFPIALNLLNINNIFVENMFIYNFAFTFLLAIIYAFILYYIIKLLEKTRITKILFGK